MTQTKQEFIKEAKAEFKKAWERDEAILVQRLSVGGKRPNVAALKVIQSCYELGFYSGLKVKIEWEE